MWPCSVKCVTCSKSLLQALDWTTLCQELCFKLIGHLKAMTTATKTVRLAAISSHSSNGPRRNWVATHALSIISIISIISIPWQPQKTRLEAQAVTGSNFWGNLTTYPLDARLSSPHLTSPLTSTLAKGSNRSLKAQMGSFNNYTSMAKLQQQACDKVALTTFAQCLEFPASHLKAATMLIFKLSWPHLKAATMSGAT